MVVLAIAVKSGSFLERGGGGTEEEKLAGCRVFLAFPRTAAAASWEPGRVAHPISSALWRRAWRVEEVECGGIMGVKYDLAYVAPNAALLMYFAGPKSMRLISGGL